MKKINVIGHVYVPLANLKDFCEEIKKIKSDVNIKDGNLRFDAKSIMALAALNKRNLLIELIPDNINDLKVFESILLKYPTL